MPSTWLAQAVLATAIVSFAGAFDTEDELRLEVSGLCGKHPNCGECTANPECFWCSGAELCADDRVQTTRAISFLVDSCTDIVHECPLLEPSLHTSTNTSGEDSPSPTPSRSNANPAGDCPVPCGDRGTCKMKRSALGEYVGYQCVCDPYFYGEACEERDPCLQWSECGRCVFEEGCGWCAENQRCSRADEGDGDIGPALGACPTWTFTPRKDSCKRPVSITAPDPQPPLPGPVVSFNYTTTYNTSVTTTTTSSTTNIVDEAGDPYTWPTPTPTPTRTTPTVAVNDHDHARNVTSGGAAEESESSCWDDECEDPDNLVVEAADEPTNRTRRDRAVGKLQARARNGTVVMRHNKTKGASDASTHAPRARESTASNTTSHRNATSGPFDAAKFKRMEAQVAKDTAEVALAEADIMEKENGLSDAQRVLAETARAVVAAEEAARLANLTLAQAEAAVAEIDAAADPGAYQAALEKAAAAARAAAGAQVDLDEAYLSLDAQSKAVDAAEQDLAQAMALAHAARNRLGVNRAALSELAKEAMASKGGAAHVKDFDFDTDIFKAEENGEGTNFTVCHGHCGDKGASECGQEMDIEWCCKSCNCKDIADRVDCEDGTKYSKFTTSSSSTTTVVTTHTKSTHVKAVLNHSAWDEIYLPPLYLDNETVAEAEDEPVDEAVKQKCPKNSTSPKCPGGRVKPSPEPRPPHRDSTRHDSLGHWARGGIGENIPGYRDYSDLSRAALVEPGEDSETEGIDMVRDEVPEDDWILAPTPTPTPTPLPSATPTLTLANLDPYTVAGVEPGEFEAAEVEGEEASIAVGDEAGCTEDKKGDYYLGGFLLSSGEKGMYDGSLGVTASLRLSEYTERSFGPLELKAVQHALLAAMRSSHLHTEPQDVMVGDPEVDESGTVVVRLAVVMAADEVDNAMNALRASHVAVALAAADLQTGGMVTYATPPAKEAIAFKMHVNKATPLATPLQTKPGPRHHNRTNATRVATPKPTPKPVGVMVPPPPSPDHLMRVAVAEAKYQMELEEALRVKTKKELEAAVKSTDDGMGDKAAIKSRAFDEETMNKLRHQLRFKGHSHHLVRAELDTPGLFEDVKGMTFVPKSGDPIVMSAEEKATGKNATYAPVDVGEVDTGALLRGGSTGTTNGASLLAGGATTLAPGAFPGEAAAGVDQNDLDGEATMHELPLPYQLSGSENSVELVTTIDSTADCVDLPVGRSTPLTVLESSAIGPTLSATESEDVQQAEDAEKSLARTGYNVGPVEPRVNPPPAPPSTELGCDDDDQDGEATLRHNPKNPFDLPNSKRVIETVSPQEQEAMWDSYQEALQNGSLTTDNASAFAPILPNCMYHGTCAACARDSMCSWCKDTSSCMTNSMAEKCGQVLKVSGSNREVITGGGAISKPEQCDRCAAAVHVDATGDGDDATTCSVCGTIAGCGWCGASRVCVAGSKHGPAVGGCDGWQFQGICDGRVKVTKVTRIRQRGDRGYLGSMPDGGDPNAMPGPDPYGIMPDGSMKPHDSLPVAPYVDDSVDPNKPYDEDMDDEDDDDDYTEDDRRRRLRRARHGLMAPVAVVVAPPKLGMCSGLTLDAQISTGPFLPIKYEWTVFRSGDPALTEVEDVFQRYLDTDNARRWGRVYVPPAVLSNMTNDVAAAVDSMPSVAVSVVAVGSDGETSQGVWHDTQLVPMDIPSVSIYDVHDDGHSREVTVDREFTLTASVRPPQCGDPAMLTPLAYRWSVSPYVAIPDRLLRRRDLVVPPDTLTANIHYNFTLRAYVSEEDALEESSVPGSAKVEVFAISKWSDLSPHDMTLGMPAVGDGGRVPYLISEGQNIRLDAGDIIDGILRGAFTPRRAASPSPSPSVSSGTDWDSIERQLVKSKKVVAGSHGERIVDHAAANVEIAPVDTPSIDLPSAPAVTEYAVPMSDLTEQVSADEEKKPSDLFGTARQVEVAKLPQPKNKDNEAPNKEENAKLDISEVHAKHTEAHAVAAAAHSAARIGENRQNLALSQGQNVTSFLEMDALMVQDDDVSQDGVGYTLTWRCRAGCDDVDVDGGGAAEEKPCLVDDGSVLLLPQNVNPQVISGDMLPDGEYLFTATATRYGVSIERRLCLPIIHDPSVHVTVESDFQGIVRPSGDTHNHLRVKVESAYPDRLPPTGLTYQWRLQEVVHDRQRKRGVTLNDVVFPPLDGSTLRINSNGLLQQATYLFACEVMDGRGRWARTARVSMAPEGRNGTLHVLPANGTSLDTTFTITARGFQPSSPLFNPVTYSFYLVHPTTRRRLPLRVNTRNATLQEKLPRLVKSPGIWLQLMLEVHAVNSIGRITKAYSTIKLARGPPRAVITPTGPAFSTAVAVGDVSRAITAAWQVSSSYALADTNLVNLQNNIAAHEILGKKLASLCRGGMATVEADQLMIMMPGIFPVAQFLSPQSASDVVDLVEAAVAAVDVVDEAVGSGAVYVLERAAEYGVHGFDQAVAGAAGDDEASGVVALLQARAQARTTALADRMVDPADHGGEAFVAEHEKRPDTIVDPFVISNSFGTTTIGSGTQMLDEMERKTNSMKMPPRMPASHAMMPDMMLGEMQLLESELQVKGARKEMLLEKVYTNVLELARKLALSLVNTRTVHLDAGRTQIHVKRVPLVEELTDFQREVGPADSMYGFSLPPRAFSSHGMLPSMSELQAAGVTAVGVMVIGTLWDPFSNGTMLARAASPAATVSLVALDGSMRGQEVRLLAMAPAATLRIPVKDILIDNDELNAPPNVTELTGLARPVCHVREARGESETWVSKPTMTDADTGGISSDVTSVVCSLRHVGAVMLARPPQAAPPSAAAPARAGPGGEVGIKADIIPAEQVAMLEVEEAAP